MEIFDTYVGNVRNDKSLAARVDGEWTVTVDDDQRRRSRFRAETADGTAVGVVVGRVLRAGDVLSTGTPDGPLLEVALEPIEAVVVDLAEARAELVTAVALGHAAGNRHWDIATRDAEVLFPATESEARMAATVEPHLPDGATVRREDVSPAVFDGDTSDAGHAHDSTHPHGHTHGPHDGSHAHGEGGDEHDGRSIEGDEDP